MSLCRTCQAELDPEDPPRYDVLNPAYDAVEDPMSDVGPYCGECWPTTHTGSQIISE